MCVRSECLVSYGLTAASCVVLRSGKGDGGGLSVCGTTDGYNLSSGSTE